MIQIPIVTDRFVIRQLQAEDEPAYLDFMLDQESTQYLAFAEEDKTLDGARAMFEFILGAYESAEPIHAYAIADRETNEYVGSCGFAPYEPGTLECYYCVNAPHRNRGAAVEATKALLEALPDSLEVRAYCHDANHGAHAVAENAGMKLSGMGTNKNTGLAGRVYVRPASEEIAPADGG